MKYDNKKLFLSILLYHFNYSFKLKKKYNKIDLLIDLICKYVKIILIMNAFNKYNI